jgi:hypothetical protein
VRKEILENEALKDVELNWDDLSTRGQIKLMLALAKEPDARLFEELEQYVRGQIRRYTPCSDRFDTRDYINKRESYRIVLDKIKKVMETKPQPTGPCEI